MTLILLSLISFLICSMEFVTFTCILQKTSPYGKKWRKDIVNKERENQHVILAISDVTEELQQMKKKERERASPSWNWQKNRNFNSEDTECVEAKLRLLNYLFFWVNCKWSQLCVICIKLEREAYSGRFSKLKHTSGDHLVLMGVPAKFTTAVEPRMQSLHSDSSAMTIPGKSLTTCLKRKCYWCSQLHKYPEKWFERNY